MINSPIDRVSFRGYSFFVKRDDLLDYDLSGNKARKLYHYIQNYNNQKMIISYGGVQSNLMYSLSALAKRLGIRFIYYSKILPSYLKDNPTSNYLGAINNGMELIEIPHSEWDEYIQSLKQQNFEDCIFVKQGGLQKEAEYGLKILACEIDEYAIQNDLEDVGLFLPSGTGATALYLQKHTKHKVYTTHCVGDSEYLKSQFLECESDDSIFPTILSLDKKYHFGNLYKEHFEMYHSLLNDTNIEFDLLYDPIGWACVMKHIDSLPKNMIYIHCGGLIGNSSMIDRYRQKFLKK